MSWKLRISEISILCRAPSDEKTCYMKIFHLWPPIMFLLLHTSVGDCVRDTRSGREWFSLALTLNYWYRCIRHLVFGKPWSKASLHPTLMVFNNCFRDSLWWKKVLSTFTTKCAWNLLFNSLIEFDYLSVSRLRLMKFRKILTSFLLFCLSIHDTIGR